MELVARGFLSAVKADDARTAQRSADAQLQQAEAELERAMITSGGREATTNPDIRTAQLQLEQAQLNRRFATLIAPHARRGDKHATGDRPVRRAGHTCNDLHRRPRRLDHR